MHIDYSAQSARASLLSGNPGYAALVEQHDDVDRRIARIENGLERPEGLTLAALRLRRSGLREDLARQQRKAGGGCCNCGNTCGG